MLRIQPRMTMLRAWVGALICGLAFAKSARAQVEQPHERPIKVAVLHIGVDDEQAKTAGDDSYLGFNLPIETLEKAADEFKEAGAEVVVLRFNCQGAAFESLKPFLNVLERSYLPRFRTVAWVRRSMDESNICAFAVPELCMTRDGGLLSSLCRWSSVAPPKGRLEELLALADRAAAMGKHPPQVLRATQVLTDLSVSVVDGERRFFDNGFGERVLSKGQGRLSLNAEDAVVCGVSRGIADDRAALAKALGLGRVEWMGEGIDQRAQAQCREAKEDTEKVQAGMGQARLSFRALQTNLSSERRRLEEGKRNAAWADVVRLRGKWPGLTASWLPMLVAAAGKEPATTWAELAKSIGIEEK
jgi:hypothetical protein